VEAVRRANPTPCEAADDRRAAADPAGARLFAYGTSMTGAVVNWRDEVVALTPSLRAFAWSLSHNGADADDLVQETLIKAWSNRDKFEPGTNLRAWLFTILRNTWYTTGGAASARGGGRGWPARRHLDQRPDAGLAPRDPVAPVRAGAPAGRAPGGDHLVGAAGLSYEEAATICGCALGTIKSRVNRARTRLLVLMNADDALDVFASEPGHQAVAAD
jgi:RNA polymerase sigma-70 factor (ECF subfamily)